MKVDSRLPTLVRVLSTQYRVLSVRLRISYSPQSLCVDFGTRVLRDLVAAEKNFRNTATRDVSPLISVKKWLSDLT